MFLRTKGLTKAFDGFLAVDSVDFDLKEGKFVSIIGPNGAGKTTFFNLLSGRLRPSAGEIWFKGENISNLAQCKRAQKGIIKSYQIITIFPNSTTFENVRIAVQADCVTYNFFANALKWTNINEKANNILKEVGLYKKRDEKASALSHGEKRYLELAIALGGNPEVLLLDEPTAGMNPTERKEMTKLIKRISEGITVILVEHDMDVVMETAEKIFVMHHGSIIAEGSAEEIQENPEVQRVYLGG